MKNKELKKLLADPIIKSRIYQLKKQGIEFRIIEINLKNKGKEKQ